MTILKNVLFIALICSLVISCKDEPIAPNEIINPDDPVASAVKNQTINLGSYIVLDASKSTKGNGNRLTYKWEDDPSNPESIRLYSDSIIYMVPSMEGVYKYTLVVNNTIKDSKPIELIVKVNPRVSNIFEDPSLEAQIRFDLKKQNGELTNVDLLSIDSLELNWQIRFYKKIKSIKGAEKLTNLKSLHLTRQSISDVTALKDLTKLERLDLSINYEIKDISPLENLINLKHLDLLSTQIKNIDKLSGLTNLEYLNILASYTKDISVITNFKKLKTFWFSSSSFKEMSIFKELLNLERLYLAQCQIDDISVFSNHTKLKELQMSVNKIKDISPLINNKNMEGLSLHENEIEDITVLEHFEKLKGLDLSNNKITNIEPLVKNKGIGLPTTIYIFKNPLDAKSINEYIPQLRARKVNIFN